MPVAEGSRGWWAISGDALMDMLRRVADGEDPADVYADEEAKCEVEDVPADDGEAEASLCRNVGSLGAGARGFVVCEKRAGHAEDLYHLQGEWRWMTGEVAERVPVLECLCFGVGGRRVPPSHRPCPRHGDQTMWENDD